MYRHLPVFWTISIACMFLLMCVSVCTGVLAQRINVENIMDGHFPAWYDSEGKKHDCGYPVGKQVLSLPSLTPEQYQEIRSIYRSFHDKDMHLVHQASVLKRQQETHAEVKEDSNLSQREYENKTHTILEQRCQNIEKAWIAAKTKLSPEQLQELVQMARSSKPKAGGKQDYNSGSEVNMRKGVRNYLW